MTLSRRDWLGQFATGLGGVAFASLLAREAVAQSAPDRPADSPPHHPPKAKRAIQTGKLPRKCGLTLVRHDQQYELTLQAETLAVSGAKLPPPAEEVERARLEERVTQVRSLIETLDLLYDAFGQRRHGAEWPKELAKMQKWLAREERARMPAAG